MAIDLRKEIPAKYQNIHEAITAFDKFLLVKGDVDNGDAITVTRVYRIPKSEFEHRSELSSAATFNDTWSRNEGVLSLFKDWDLRLPINSPYDCTGRLCDLSNKVLVHTVYNDRIVVVLTTYRYDV